MGFLGSPDLYGRTEPNRSNGTRQTKLHFGGDGYEYPPITVGQLPTPFVNLTLPGEAPFEDGEQAAYMTVNTDADAYVLEVQVKGTEPLELIAWHFVNPLDVSYALKNDEEFKDDPEVSGFFVQNLGYTRPGWYKEGTNDLIVYNMNRLRGNAADGCIQRFYIEPNKTGEIPKPDYSLSDL